MPFGGSSARMEIVSFLGQIIRNCQTFLCENSKLKLIYRPIFDMICFRNFEVFARGKMFINIYKLFGNNRCHHGSESNSFGILTTVKFILHGK